MKFPLFLILTVGYFILAAILFPFAWSRRVRAVHHRAALLCRRIYGV